MVIDGYRWLLVVIDGYKWVLVVISWLYSVIGGSYVLRSRALSVAYY